MPYGFNVSFKNHKRQFYKNQVSNSQNFSISPAAIVHVLFSPSGLGIPDKSDANQTFPAD